jgi:hypothetical protein
MTCDPFCTDGDRALARRCQSGHNTSASCQGLHPAIAGVLQFRS